MYSYYSLTDEAQARFEGLERDLDRPIAIHPWTRPGLTLRAFTYDAEHFPDFTAEDCRERGITIICGGGPSVDRGDSSYLLHDGDEYEAYLPIESPDIPIELDGNVIGEIVLPNQVFAYVSWQYYLTQSWGEALVNAYAEAVIACVDPELLTNWEATREERRREALTRFVRNTYDRQLIEHRELIDVFQRGINEAQEQISVNLRNLRQRQELLDAVLLVRDNDSGERVLREWDLLQQHPRVARCTFESDALVVTTTDDLRLYRDDTDESRWLGAFEIRIDLNRLKITMQNLNTRRGGRDHPHITDGVPCFGGHAHDFAQLLGNGELLVVFELCIQYLERLNLADEYGRYGAYWFDVPDERPLDTETEAVAV